MSLNSRRVALLVAANTALAPFAIDAYLPAMPALAAAVGASVHHAELSLSSFLVGFAVGQLVCGPLSDRLGRKPVLLGGQVVFMLASLAIIFVDSLPALLVLRFIQALGGGACVVNSAAIVRDCFSGREAAKVMSTMAMILMLAPLVAPAIGSMLLYLADWWLIFLFLALYSIFLILSQHAWLPETRAPDLPVASPRQVLRNYASVLTDRRAMGYILATSMAFAGIFAFVTSSPFLYLEHYGLSPGVYPLVFGANVAVMVMSSRLNIHLLRKRTPQQNLGLGLAIQWCAGVGLVIVVASGRDTIYTVAPLVMMFLGVMGLISPNAITALLDRFGHMSATATALQGCIQFSLGALVGILVTALEIDSAWPMVIAMIAVATIGNLGFRVLVRGSDD